MTSDPALPSADFDRLLRKFWFWSGDAPPPQFSHWTAQGTVFIRAETPAISTEVLWRPHAGVERRLGGDDSNPIWPARNIAAGHYDADAGVAISSLVPENLAEWNNLGG